MRISKLYTPDTTDSSLHFILDCIRTFPLLTTSHFYAVCKPGKAICRRSSASLKQPPTLIHSISASSNDGTELGKSRSSLKVFSSGSVFACRGQPAPCLVRAF